MTVDQCIEELTQNQPQHNQHAFREMLHSIVRLAKSEARVEAINVARDHLLSHLAERVH